jgi:hypothetical protein
MLWTWTGHCSFSKKYIAVRCPEHPRAWSNGYMLEHILIAENTLGRLLDTDEVVHHLDGNGKNNSPDNLKVLKRSAHTIKHQLGNGHGDVILVCDYCGSEFFREYKNRPENHPESHHAFCSRSCSAKFQHRK